SAPYQAAIALISSSENPLAMRSITVAGSCPDLKPCIAVTMSAGLRPTSRGTVVSTQRAVGWQPEQDAAPAGASAGPAAEGLAMGRGGKGGGSKEARSSHVKAPKDLGFGGETLPLTCASGFWFRSQKRGGRNNV